MLGVCGGGSSQTEQQGSHASPPLPEVPRQLEPHELSGPQREQVAEESAAVAPAHAVAHHGAVVVELLHAPVARHIMYM